jgi:hypothetical protein
MSLFFDFEPWNHARFVSSPSYSFPIVEKVMFSATQLNLAKIIVRVKADFAEFHHALLESVETTKCGLHVMTKLLLV